MRRILPFGLTAALLGATVALASPATAAGAATQVALLVQYPGGGTATYCVDHADAMTGSAVLAAAGPTYGSGVYTGFVLRIGGQGTVPPTNDTYWAYWRSAGDGSYAYSDSGVTSTRPAAGSVEAWVWNAGAPAAFPHRTYAQLCPAGFAVAAPAPAPTTAAAPTTAPAVTPTTVTPTTTRGASSQAVTPATPVTTAGSTPGAPSATPTTVASDTGPTTARSIRASPVAEAAPVGRAGPAVGVIVGALAVLALGGAAIRQRRRRGAEG